jgi:FlaA1/EpsC-like NDP-sugar epimerase
MIKLLNKMKSWEKTALAMMHDIFMAAVSFYLSIAIRLDAIFLTDPILESQFLLSLVIITLTQFITFYFFGLYKGIWRYSSTDDLLRVIKGVTFGIITSYGVRFFLFRLDEIPRSSVIIDWFLLIITLGGGRLAYRLLRDKTYQSRNPTSAKRVLIVGAGSAGEQLYREIRKNAGLPYNILGFIDDDNFKQNKILHGVKILGNTEQLPEIIENYQINKIFIAMPSARGDKVEKVVNSCSGLKIDIKILPKMSDIINGHFEVSQLRNVNIEDILGRKEIFLNQNSIKSIIQDKTVFISGAGGSIGSELVIQILKFNPKYVYLFDISEINLFNLERRVQALQPENQYNYIIGDIRNKPLLDQIFSEVSPDIVLHTAAYKHVPLMEKNPIQAINTNIFGTLNIAELSIKYKVSKYVQVSTDKAVNPTNIMGVSKRIAEILCQDLQNRTKTTSFTTVRFGNVLGSSGSVIPVFKEQILKGGPVTVTHPDIERFFMSIPEASQLILQAATLGNGGEIFVLDMGKPIKIVDLAKQLINLSKAEEGREIEIQFTGLRPGEKLFEELLADKECTLPTTHPLVRTAQSVVPSQNIINKIIQLKSLTNLSPDQIKNLLLEIVPEYDPKQTQNQEFTSVSLKEDQLH